jgi:ADP-ribosylglycohydrolase
MAKRIKPKNNKTVEKSSVTPLTNNQETEKLESTSELNVSSENQNPEVQQTDNVVSEPTVDGALLDEQPVVPEPTETLVIEVSSLLLNNDVKVQDSVKTKVILPLSSDDKFESSVTVSQSKSKHVKGLLDHWVDAESKGLMYRSLLGIALGDAFGMLFGEFPKDPSIIRNIGSKVIPPEKNAPSYLWRWSDDTVAATAIVKTLEEFNGIDQEELSDNLVSGYNAYSDRGFGGGFKKLMVGINAGGSWKKLSKDLFDGIGSFGNGSAMRVAPVGAFLHDTSIQAVIQEATESAEVSHAHPEGIAGAVAVALASYFLSQENNEPRSLLNKILEHMPESETKNQIKKISHVDIQEHPSSVAELYGTGMAPKSTKISTTCQHTVPFCLWMVQRSLLFNKSFSTTMWEVAECLGDIDTTCAIVGGILACNKNIKLPQEWISKLEPIPVF